MKNIAGIKVKVYAAGLYVDEQVAKRSLGKYKRTPAAELKHNNTLFTDLIMEKALEKTVQLVFARGVKGPAVLNALDERLRPTLEGTPELDEFRTYFNGVKLEKGQSLSFSSVYGVLTTKKDGKVLGSINSVPLCNALFDVYLGSDPVMPPLRDQVGESLARILHQ
mmetsp:Transcript_43929/g.82142  ORF Transcript_43929/g.82142 Transcript_43929/m.82142 type:complete len:166 (-) Transcript_43929:304-801(-)